MAACTVRRPQGEVCIVITAIQTGLMAFLDVWALVKDIKTLGIHKIRDVRVRILSFIPMTRAFSFLKFERSLVANGSVLVTSNDFYMCNCCSFAIRFYLKFFLL